MIPPRHTIDPTVGYWIHPNPKLVPALCGKVQLPRMSHREQLRISTANITNTPKHTSNPGAARNYASMSLMWFQLVLLHF